MIKYYDERHKMIFADLIRRMKSNDCYHLAIAYLIALDYDCRNRIESVFDIENDTILPDCLHSGWQTGTSLKTLRLAFNLWNGYCFDTDTYIDQDGQRSLLPSSSYAVDSIFCSTYAPYYWEAIKLRYPEYTQ